MKRQRTYRATRRGRRKGNGLRGIRPKQGVISSQDEDPQAVAGREAHLDEVRRKIFADQRAAHGEEWSRNGH